MTISPSSLNTIGIRANQLVNTIVEFKKLGRIFKGCSDGVVSEIEMHKRSSLFGLVPSKVSVKTNDMNKSWAQHLIPEVLRIGASKSIDCIKIDEERNLLYALGTYTDGKLKD